MFFVIQKIWKHTALIYGAGGTAGTKCKTLLSRPQCCFSCHCRLVLSAVSDYFAAMFTNDVREAKQEEIKMEGVDPEALRSLVHFAYTGEPSDDTFNFYGLGELNRMILLRNICFYMLTSP